MYVYEGFLKVHFGKELLLEEILNIYLYFYMQYTPDCVLAAQKGLH